MIITIDGYAGSGKSTAARLLADALGFELLNTGAMYRATALVLGRAGIDIHTDPRDVAAITAAVAGYRFDLHADRVWINDIELTKHVYTEAMGRAASRVGTFPEVRAKLKAEQRRIADDRDVVCEGRDQGTAVFPHAPVKFFFTASAETRATRRADQEGLPAEAVPELVAQISARDRQDEQRAIDPLRRADGAVLIDTSHIAPDAVVARMLEVVDRCRSRV
ncbi:MAG: (d)CMP kinase [Gemmataceae bacterium]